MAFFVLILSFAEFNVPKFKQISGSLREAFGVQKVVPVVEQPKGTTVISLEFSPSPTPAITDTLRQQTTELQQPELELQTETEDPLTVVKLIRKINQILPVKAVRVQIN